MKDRVLFLDIAKGIGALLVIVCHFCIFGPLQTIISAFHMPLFFFIAGITYSGEPKSFKAYGSKYGRQLLIPYLLFSLPIFVIKAVRFLQSNSYIEVWKTFVGIFICWKGTQYYNGVWFLPCMFAVYVIAYFFNNIKGKGRLLLATICFLIGWLLAVTHVVLPLCLDTAFVSLGFFLLGQFMSIEKCVNIFTGGAKVRFVAC